MNARLASLLLVFCWFARVAQAAPDLSELQVCSNQLRTIYAAIQAYQADNKDIPNWLSDLVPKYLPDANILICPVCKRTGESELGPVSDPNLPSSYLFEFCPAPFVKKDGVKDRSVNHRDWKRRQMGLVGSIVPLVRCRHHDEIVLNLAFDGRIYESGTMWENVVSNRIDPAALKPAQIFATTGNNQTSHAGPVSYPARDPATASRLINLSAYYNAQLNKSWQGVHNDLALLPTGRQNFGGVDYDVRGLIQLCGGSSFSKKYPERVDDILIQQKCSRLHFLHACTFGHLDLDGQRLGSYVIHYASNEMQLVVPIIYGRDVRGWHPISGEKPAEALSMVWCGTNTVTDPAHRPMRLFTTTWENIAPNMPIKSIDFVSALATAAPFLVAITAE